MYETANTTNCVVNFGAYMLYEVEFNIDVCCVCVERTSIGLHYLFYFVLKLIAAIKISFIKIKRVPVKVLLSTGHVLQNL